ncbi:hypothetical protein BBOV_III009850 [Babesia bovis T2Bo]|uniref:WD domain, G-beta repeat containing protein n=1 Tax=Babesia bovis TaxID=5865 RepID=A7APQ7_BABBO|nr:hypothetical protein BBOV_III009850 [Babesia bovis T2Bo]EDO08541.1 hypothetical protein BBOV_III009850 [Babesia bovis T2Bo]|eukprot:XP_001612109.1 hypothetical protein [Babesia bovis T2Bo]
MPSLTGEVINKSQIDANDGNHAEGYKYNDENMNNTNEGAIDSIDKKEYINVVLSNMDIGNASSVALKNFNVGTEPKQGGEEDDLINKIYDEMNTVEQPGSMEGYGRNKMPADENRESAYYNKNDNAHNHYLKHFTDGAYVDKAIDEDTTDETDFSSDELSEQKHIETEKESSSILTDKQERNDVLETEFIAGVKEDCKTEEYPIQMLRGHEELDTNLTPDESNTNVAVHTGGINNESLVETEETNTSLDTLDSTAPPENLNQKLSNENPTGDTYQADSDQTVDEIIYKTPENLEEVTEQVTQKSEFFSVSGEVDESNEDFHDVNDDPTYITEQIEEMNSKKLSAGSLVEVTTTIELDDALELRRAGARHFGNNKDEEDVIEIENVAIAKELSEHTSELLKDGRPKSSPSKGESVTSLNLSDSKSLLAVGTLRGSLIIFQTKDRNITNNGYGTPLKQKRQGLTTLPDSILWVVMTRKPAVSVEAHIGAVKHIYIIEMQGNNDGSAKIVTSGDDNNIRFWNFSTTRGPPTLTLIGAQYAAVEPIAVVPIVNKHQIILAMAHGRIDYWEMYDNKDLPVHMTQKMTMRQTKHHIKTQCEILNVEISPSGKTFAVESTAGWLMLYDSNKRIAVGVADCRNRKGKWRRGANVNGVHWSKNESLILVTTGDNRIRMLTTKPYEEDELLELEKFKGHINERMRLKAEFIGNKEEYVICLSEDQSVCVWKHHIDTRRSSFNEIDIKPTNADCMIFKYEDQPTINHMCIFNPGEWKQVRQIIIQQQRQYGVEASKLPISKCGCLPWVQPYTHPETTNVTNIDTNDHILIAAPKDDKTLRYSLIAISTLKAAFS